MSDWRHNSSGNWSSHGSGHGTQYPNTIEEIEEEELEDEQAYADTGEYYTTAPEQEYQPQDDQIQYQHQGYWTDEPQTYQSQDQTVYMSEDQQYYQYQQYYQHPDTDQGEVPYTPTTHTGSMDVNFSEHGQDNVQQEPATPPPPLDEDPDTGHERTQDFVAQRSESYDRHDEFRTAPATASIRRVVDTRQRIRDADARARARARGRGRGSGSRPGGDGVEGSSGGGSSRGGGSGSGGKSSGSKGSSSKSGGRS
ncbi:hypothetical protein BR93DRAFT_937294 [Coniochaeta sp. PMI_546]|nr:hypothetical protein BR93DRAFT_937294 [Coniochaeta sp. PMI_546]